MIRSLMKWFRYRYCIYGDRFGDKSKGNYTKQQVDERLEYEASVCREHSGLPDNPADWWTH